MAKLIIEGQTHTVPDELVRNGSSVAEQDENLRQALRPNFDLAANATFQRVEKDGELTVTVIKAPGRKGSGSAGYRRVVQRLLEAPLKFLPRCLLPRTIEEAGDYLDRRLETATLFFVCDRRLPQIFEKRFPREWARDQEKILPPDADTPYSEGELKCLELIAEHLFPFAYEHLEMVAQDEGERMCVIPLYSFGIELWNYGLGDLSRGWRMLALLNRDLSAQDDLVPRCVRA